MGMICAVFLAVCPVVFYAASVCAVVVFGTGDAILDS